VDLPGVNVLVRLARRPGGAELASRVEDVTVSPVPGPGGRATRYLVAAPQYPGDLVEPDPDEEWLLSWVTERARWEVPVRRADAPGRTPRSWWVTPAGPVRRQQRRRFYRAACSTGVTLELLAAPWGVVPGRTVDVSEGGVRCLLPVVGVEPGTRVLVRLDLDGVDELLEGVVLRTRRPGRSARVAGWWRELAVALDDPERHGDAIRRVVVRMQLRARRLAPPGSR
jgi:hypothetical protein